MTNKIVNTITPPGLMTLSRKILMHTRRQSVAKKLAGQKRLHLACGNNVLEGWANIDLKSSAKVIGWNLTHDLPVRSGAIELIYCEHFIEHISLNQARTLLAECYRCLRTDGILRLSTPSLKKLVNEYLSGRSTEWSDLGWNPATPCQMVNEGFRLWGHQFVYDDNELKRILNESGFRKIRPVAWRDSTISDLRNLECRPFHDEIILEAIK